MYGFGFNALEFFHSIEDYTSRSSMIVLKIWMDKNGNNYVKCAICEFLKVCVISLCLMCSLGMCNIVFIVLTKQLRRGRGCNSELLDLSDCWTIIKI